jgi:phosphoesterase RecJ-like protein
MASGMDFNNLSETVYWFKTREGALLSGICMSRMRFLEKERLVWSIVRREDFLKIGGRSEDVDTVANDMLSIKDVKISVFFRENDNGLLKVSLRSKHRLNVGGLAIKYGGGGHFDAAGCSIANTKSAMEKILREAAALLK